MRIKNLLIPVDAFKAILMGNLEIDWLAYPKGTKIHKIVFDKKKNVYYVCIYHKDFDEINVIDEGYGRIPVEDALVRNIPGMPIQILMFLQVMFPVLLQDYAQMQHQIKDKTAEEQTKIMVDLYRMRITQYLEMSAQFTQHVIKMQESEQ